MPVKVTESYVDYSPPLDYKAIATRLLATVPEKYLVGLDSVVLCNFSGQPRRLRTGTLPRRGRRIRRQHVAGLYHPEWRGQKAWIQVFVDQIKMPPRSLRWIGLLCDVVLGHVLYHELGHHVHTIRPEYREKEDVADNWAVRFSRNHVRKTYWFLYPLLRGIALLRKATLKLANSNRVPAKRIR
jgi:hypothetical protein